MGKFLSMDKVCKMAGVSSVESLQELGLNAGRNFLEGKVTSVFAGEVAPTLLSPMAEILIGTAGVKDAVKSINVPKIVHDMIQGAITQITSQGISMTVTAVTEIAKPPDPAYLAKRTAYYTNMYIVKPATILKQMTVTEEQAHEESEKKSEASGLSKFTSGAIQTAGEVKAAMNTFTGNITSYIGMIESYALQGPDWAANQVDRQVTACIDRMQDYIDKKKAAALDAKADFIETEAEKLGKAAAEKINVTTAKLMKEKTDKPKTLAVKAMVKAKILAQQNILKLMAKTGINIS